MFADGKLRLTLKGETIVAEFLKILEHSVDARYGRAAVERR